MPKAAIVSIGHEVADGRITDTNAAWLSQQLSAAGLPVAVRLTVPDEEEAIGEALAWASARSDIIVGTGGLGPTSDDLTTRAVARWIDVPLVRDAASLEAIAAVYASRGRRMPETNQKQADFPQGAEPLPNPRGTAPGFQVQHEGKRLFFLPGVPGEMKAMYAAQVEPRLPQVPRPAIHVFRTFGAGESTIAEWLQEIEPGLIAEGVHVGYRASVPEVVLTLAGPLTTRLREAVRAALGEACYGEGDARLPERIVERLDEAGRTLACAESCTGGGLGAAVTAVPGASRVLRGGVIAYDEAIKTALLDVDAQLLAEHGAVSEPVALAMATGVRQRVRSDYGLAVTGFAGPDGGTPEAPVGTVWVAVSGPEGALSRRWHFAGGRERVRAFAAWAALDLLRQLATGAVRAR